MAECPCGKVFEPKNRNQLYHEVKCARDGAAQGLKPPLKAPFMGRVKVRGLTRRAAADQIGIGYSALRTWWQTPGSRLQDNNLALMAAWLEISIDEALRLQGGTAEERRKALALAGLKTHNEEVRRDPKLALKAAAAVAKAVQAMNSAVRGTHQSEEHRDGIQQGVKAYRSRPGAHPLGQHHNTRRGKAQQLLRSLKGHHPEWSESKLLEEADRRLREPPYSIRDGRVRHLILAPKQRVGRPPREDRCKQLCELLAQVEPDRNGGLPRGFVKDAVRALSASEGSVKQDALRRFLTDHDCPRLLAALSRFRHRD
jgi:hypothetical protein